jgi:hypothetical protein
MKKATLIQPLLFQALHASICMGYAIFSLAPPSQTIFQMDRVESIGFFMKR